MVKIHTLNPKSITHGLSSVLARSNQATQEWTDGLVPTLVRLSVNDETDNKNWVTFDGPVDALWIENMNTVLDDNKMLCLSNGERIKLSASMHMVFEVNDLSVASPATVSRCGMVFMEAVYIGQAPYITSWTQHKLVKTLPQHVQRFDKLLNKYAVPAIEFFLEECREGLTQGIAAQYLRNMFNIMDSVLLPEHGVSAGKGGVEGMINQWFIFAFIWAIGGNSHDDSRTKFDAYVRDCGILKELDPTFPKEGLVFDYCVSAEQQSFVPWSSLMPPFAYVPGMPYFNILVPTGETTCYDFLLKVLIANGTHILTCGETGSGKSVLVQGFLTRMNPDTSNSIQAAFSAQTAAKNMRDILESKLDKLRKNLLGAPPGRQTVIFVDDINMPALETYGAQPPIELVRQVLSQGGFYDLKKLFFKAVQNTAFIAACGPPGGGRNALTPRLVRHFNLLWIPQLSKEGMQRIFISILERLLQRLGLRRRSQGARRAVDQGDGQHLQPDARSDAADPVQVALHVQPARRVARVPGHPADHACQVRGCGELPAPLGARDVPCVPRPPHQQRGQGHLLRVDHRRAQVGQPRQPRLGGVDPQDDRLRRLHEHDLGRHRPDLQAGGRCRLRRQVCRVPQRLQRWPRPSP